MKEVMIRLSTIQDVNQFVKIVAAADQDIDLSSGRYVVDGKSIMGIFSLDLMNPIKMSIHGDHVEEILEQVKSFIVK
jgi:phosphotransferase system HPr-like phosphotransfer protein